MQRLDHIAKFVDRAKGILTGTVGPMRCKEGDGRVSPVVDKTRRTVLRVELKDGQQFYCCNAKLLEIENLLDESAIGAPYLPGYTRTRMPCEAPHVHLVHDCLRGGPTERSIALPIVRARIHHNAFHRGCSVLATFRSSLPVVPLGDRDSATVRIKKCLAGIKAQAVPRIKRPVDSITINLSRSQTGYEYMPIVVRAVYGGIDRDHALWAGIILTIKQ